MLTIAFGAIFKSLCFQIVKNIWKAVGGNDIMHKGNVGKVWRRGEKRLLAVLVAKLKSVNCD